MSDTCPECGFQMSEEESGNGVCRGCFAYQRGLADGIAQEKARRADGEREFAIRVLHNIAEGLKPGCVLGREELLMEQIKAARLVAAEGHNRGLADGIAQEKARCVRVARDHAMLLFREAWAIACAGDRGKLERLPAWGQRAADAIEQEPADPQTERGDD